MAKSNEATLQRTPHKVVRGSHVRYENGDRVIYGIGDEMGLTDKEAKTREGAVQPMPGQYTPKATSAKVGGSEDTGTGNEGTAPTPSGLDWKEVLSQPVAAVVAQVGEMDNPDHLRELLDAEVDGGKNRKGVTDAINDRLIALVGG